MEIFIYSEAYKYIENNEALSNNTSLNIFKYSWYAILF